MEELSCDPILSLDLPSFLHFVPFWCDYCFFFLLVAVNRGFLF